ncbi:neutral cholesterol ester hydrolase 1 isoform X1 [Microcaecilia unicolor]|uniref:Neutral cholesterol ester hydrolase 1 n=3 Tax=Microcaecilia unicolor TaxID=1415580 RepID=A0A6P7Z9S0_9AMPH|nr:neutral cholesterol ester hydrolase 1 isoform X1 [Microcaecilia unicolor]
MKGAWVLLAAFASFTAYYVYLPLPSAIAEPWKLMMLDAVLRSIQDLSNLVHFFGFSHHLRVLNFVSGYMSKLDAESCDNVKVTDTVFDGVQIRIFDPIEKRDKTLKRGVIYLHGGGWTLEGARMRTYDQLCRAVAEGVNAVVVSVEYRILPDVHFPEQLNDALHATKYFLQPDVLAKWSVDPNRIALSGDSSGGNLAAAVCQQLIQDGNAVSKIKLQALIYPVLQVLDFNTPSYQQNMDMPILRRFLMAKFWLHYLNGNSKYVEPMLVNNHTSFDVSQAVALRERLNWSSILPSGIQKHFKPVVQTVGTPELIQEVPAIFDVRASPLIAEKESLKLMPKTYILTCEYDVLRDDGLMYAKRLEDAGVEVTNDHYEDGFHGCMIFADWPLYFSVGARTRDNYIKWLDENL